MDAEQPGAHGATVIPPGYRLQNGKLVPGEQPAITRIIPKLKPEPDPRRWWVLVGAALLILSVVLVALATKGPEHPVRVAPTGEKKFLEAVRHGQDRVRHGNPVTLVSARQQRMRTLCRDLEDGDQKVRGWVGTVHDIDTQGDGEGVITVSIGDDTDLRTGSGMGAEKRILLRPRSDVFESVANLHDGDRVVFDGAFVPDGTACVNETSIFDRNGMLTPDFLFMFSSIAPA
jgi:hypothetical protein